MTLPTHEPTGPVDVLTMGRSGVDIYPLETGVALEDVANFGKFLGGTTMNVAVASARLGHSAATITGVGTDPFGRYVRREMQRLGVSDTHVIDVPELATPVTFCEIFPPDDFPLYFYRKPSAPDLQIRPGHIPRVDTQQARIVWFSVTGLSEAPSRSAHHAAAQLRAQRRHTVLDLDYRPMFWATRAEATEQVREFLPEMTVAVGNLEECEVAVGESEPEHAADALLEAGVELAVVKQGPLGTLAKTPDERVEIPPTPTQVVNGLGAGDAFGGSLCHGLLQGWSLHRTITAASAAGAIVASRLECSTAMPTSAELLEVIDAGLRPEDVERQVG